MSPLMIINLDIIRFREAINTLLSVVDKKNTRPILGYIHFSASSSKLILTATDLEVSAKIILDADVQGEGSFCVNGKNLFDIVRELPNQNLVLSVNDKTNTLNLNCALIEYSLLILGPDDFPKIDFQSSLPTFEINSAKLRELISKTSHAISNDETRIYLNGIFLQEVNSRLRAVATDGHRLSLYEMDFDDKQKIDALINGVIIPKKGVYELKRMAETDLSSIKIALDESFLLLNSSENYFLSIRLISREYPKYQAVIPSRTSFKLITDKNLLFNAVKRIKIMANEKSNGVRIKISSKELVITANHPSLGNAQEKMDVNYDGKEMVIGFNAKYLMETLSALDEGEVSFELNNELSPVIVKSDQHPNYLGIVMPLKL